MIVSIDNVIRYLLEIELVDLRSIVEEDLSIVPVSGKNKDIKILRGNNKSYFIKQANQIDANGVEMLTREAKFYRLVQSESNLQDIKPMLTSMIMFDEHNKIVILDLIENGLTLRQLLYDDCNEELHIHAAASLGYVLGTVHRVPINPHDNGNLSFLSRRLPPTFFLTCPTPEIFRQLSSANLQLLKIVHKYRNFHESLQELHKLWRVNALIHGDIRLDNVILSYGSEAQNVNAKLIDWEYVDFGDPAWDIGGAFSEFLSLWVFSLGDVGEEQLKERPIVAEDSLIRVQKLVRALWHSYMRATEIASSEANDLLDRAAKYCAARLVQTAYESQHQSPELSNKAVYMLQISSNILSRTKVAITYLLGIPYGGS